MRGCSVQDTGKVVAVWATEFRCSGSVIPRQARPGLAGLRPHRARAHPCSSAVSGVGGLRVLGSRFRTSGLRDDKGSGFRVQGAELRVQACRVEDSGSGCRVES